MNELDLIVIGSGQGGIPLANARARAGHRVALFERGHLGGSCVNYGCTPSKTLLASAHMAAVARRASHLGIHCDPRVDFQAVMQRVRDVRDTWRQGVNRTEDVENLTVVHAEARFVDRRVIEADGRRYTAPLIVIDTGTRANIPPIDGIDHVAYLTNQTIFELTACPRRLAVLGGGYVGCELGQAFEQLGSHVTLVEGESLPMPHEDACVGEALQAAFEADGLTLHMNRRIEQVEQVDDGAIRCRLDSGDAFEADALLVAAGRRPNTDALDAEAGGIELDDRGHVRVDDQLRTTADGVYAIGDVAGQPAFTHVSYEDHRRLLDIVEGGSRTRDDRVLSYACFTDPQVGRCGMNERQAAEAGIACRCEEKNLGQSARGVEWDYTNGYARVVVEKKTEKLIGATIVGHEAAELVHMFIAPIEHGLTWGQLSETVPIHPTFGEAMHALMRQFAE